MTLADQTAVVTGAASGIGAAVARDLRARGVRVAGLDIDPCPDCHAGYEIDVSDVDAVHATVERVVRDLGPPTLAVHSAGITRDRVFWKLARDDWDSVLAVNLTAAMHLLRAVLPHQRTRERGSVVLIGSINGDRGKFGQTAYAASKAGLVGLAKSAAREVGRFGVRVNVVSPGMVETAMTAMLPQEFRDQAVAESVLGRIAEPDDVASVVGFLLSDEARHITGQVIRVDGGQNM